LGKSTVQEVAATGLPKPSVLARTAAGMGWIVGWRLATRFLGLVNTLVLVRLLAPADFGLVALGTTFVIAVDTLSTLGVEDALVRDHAPTPDMYDTAFTLTVLRSIATALVICVVAVPVAAFFAEPRLAYILWALAVGALIAGCGSMGPIDFRRDMDFGKEFTLQMLPRIVSIVLTIGGALIWRSYWALVAGILAGRIVRTVFSYCLHPWRPRFTLAAWRALIAFSLWSWAISMAELVRDRMDTFVIGRIINPTSVGIYAIGEEIAALPTNELVLPLCRACFSGFAAARSDGQGLSETFMRPIATTFLVTLPAGLGISLVADPLVRLTVGENWSAAISIIQVLGIMGGVAVFGYVASTLLSVHALLRQRFVITIICLMLRLLLIIPLISRFGILGAAIGAFAGATIEHVAFIITIFGRFKLSWREFGARIWRPIAAGAVMSSVLFVTNLGWSRSVGDATEIVRTLVVAVSLGAVLYVLTLGALWWLSGRPPGAESDVLALIKRVARRGRFQSPGATALNGSSQGILDETVS
jgi:lipopolysaccharide exporter